jgi:hypothetical protein
MEDVFIPKCLRLVALLRVTPIGEIAYGRRFSKLVSEFKVSSNVKSGKRPPNP